MPEPRLMMLVVSQVLTEVQEGGCVNRAIGKLHPERLEDADAIVTSRADQVCVVIHDRSLDTGPLGDTPYAGRLS